MSRIAPLITLNNEETKILKSWSRSRSMPYRQVMRAKVILLASEGITNKDIAKNLKLTRPTVQLWRERFLSLGIRGLEKDATRPGRKPKLSPKVVQSVITYTLYVKPISGSRWTTRGLAEIHGISAASVRRIWLEHGIAPHLAKKARQS